MATAKKLPSGNYRCLVYDYTDSNGKKKYKSFTAKTKKQAELLAAEYLNDKQEESCESIKFKKAMENYIHERENVLSPSTIRGYWKIYRTLTEWHNKDVAKITQEDIQILINSLARSNAPKTVSNIHGFIVSTIHVYRPQMAIKTALPKVNKADIYIPTEDDIKILLDTALNTSDDIYNAILLGAFGGMRRSEISAAQKSDLKDNVLHVNKAMVDKEGGGYVVKSPKSVAGNRFIPLPDFVASRFKDSKGNLVQLNPHQITRDFNKVLKVAKLPHFRFHDLRHYCVSIQHALGIPDQYIMDFVGHSSTSILQKVYRHSMSDQEKKMNEMRQDYFSKFENIQHEMQHEN